jgi:hypothetical protein
MSKILFTIIEVLGAVLMTSSRILFQVPKYFSQTQYTGTGWNRLASVSWNS